MKSYGRAPTFLALTGYEQVRSVAAELAGDHEAASRVELRLPDTGVCGGAGLSDAAAHQPAEPSADQAAGGCCGGPSGSSGDGCNEASSASHPGPQYVTLAGLFSRR